MKPKTRMISKIALLTVHNKYYYQFNNLLRQLFPKISFFSFDLESFFLIILAITIKFILIYMTRNQLFYILQNILKLSLLYIMKHNY